MSDHIQTLFGRTEEGYEPPPDPQPGDGVWRKLGWILYPLMLAAIFVRGPHSQAVNEIFWTVFVMGLLVTNESSQIKKRRVQLHLAVAFLLHLAVMSLIYGLLPKTKAATCNDRGLSTGVHNFRRPNQVAKSAKAGGSIAIQD